MLARVPTSSVKRAKLQLKAEYPELFNSDDDCSHKLQVPKCPPVCYIRCRSIYLYTWYIYIWIYIIMYIYIYAHPAATSLIFLERISKLSETSWWQCFSPSFCKCTLPLTSPRTGTNCCAVGHHIGQHKAVLKLTLQGATLPQLFGGPSLGALR